MYPEIAGTAAPVVDVSATLRVTLWFSSGVGGVAVIVATRSPALPGGVGPGGVGFGGVGGVGGDGGGGDGFGFGFGVGGVGGAGTRIVAVPIASPARATIVAEVVPDQVTLAWPLASVRGEASESSPVDAVSVSGTFGAETFPLLLAAVAMVSSSDPPPAGRSQLSGVRKIAAATPSGAGPAAGGAGAVGERRVHPADSRSNSAIATLRPRVRPMI
jgi:hypothetical protein